MNKTYRKEIIDFIKEKKMEDVFTLENTFFEFYKCELYVYLRVSTKKQDFRRQLIEIYEWSKRKKIQIYVNNIFFDKYSGKKEKCERYGYMALKERIKEKDYLLTTNLNRLGRNWDDIKKEWYSLECDNINRIIIDNDNLSVELPNELKKEMSLNRKMVQDITFSACLYSACQKIEEVRQSTRDGLKDAIAQGKVIGKPRGENSTIQNFINTLKLQVEKGYTQKSASLMTKYPERTYKNDLKSYYEKYNTRDLKIILKKVERENK